MCNSAALVRGRFHLSTWFAQRPSFFSVIAPEWPRVKAGLEARLDAP